MNKFLLILTAVLMLWMTGVGSVYAGDEMIEPNDLLETVIVPVLEDMDELWPGANHPAAPFLMLGTLYQESTIGKFTHLKQHGGGPGKGPWQHEPDTHFDSYVNYLITRHDKLKFAIEYLSRKELSVHEESILWAAHENAKPSLDEQQLARVAEVVRSPGMDAALTSNLKYAAFQARLKYWRSSFDWPSRPADLHALGKIWDDHYNANDQHGFPEDFVAKFPLSVLT